MPGPYKTVRQILSQIFVDLSSTTNIFSHQRLQTAHVLLGDAPMAKIKVHEREIRRKIVSKTLSAIFVFIVNFPGRAQVAQTERAQSRHLTHAQTEFPYSVREHMS